MGTPIPSPSSHPYGTGFRLEYAYGLPEPLGWLWTARGWPCVGVAVRGVRSASCRCWGTTGRLSTRVGLHEDLCVVAPEPEGHRPAMHPLEGPLVAQTGGSASIRRTAANHPQQPFPRPSSLGFDSNRPHSTAASGVATSSSERRSAATPQIPATMPAATIRAEARR